MIPKEILSHPALLAITRRGAQQAAKLAQQWPKAKLYILEPWDREIDADVQPLKAPLRHHVQKLLENHTLICFFCALGAVVRLIAPHLRSKQTDPAVLAIDEKNQFVIPVISGHLGGANGYAIQVAKILDAQPIITTASDAIGTLAVDLLGRESGWRTESNPNTLTSVAAQIVNMEPVAVVQECGDRHWLTDFPNLPKNIHLLDHIEQADPDQHQGLLWITHEAETKNIADKWPQTLVIYRPPRGQNAPLSVGLGCDRGTPLTTLENALETALSGQYLRINDIQSLATIEQKRDEVGLLALANKLNLPLTLYSAEQLARIPVPNPSITVLRHMGTPSVSEASALLAAATTMENLLVEKYCYRGPDGKSATVSIALTVSITNKKMK